MNFMTTPLRLVLDSTHYLYEFSLLVKYFS